MKIWITGCSGFLGTRLSTHFSTQGHEVVGLSRRNCSAAITSKSVDLANSAAREFLQSLIKTDGPPDVVIHTAAKQPGSGELSTFVNSNVRAASNVIEALQDSPPAQIIYTSTLSVYGRPGSLPVDESRPAGGNLPYGATKRWAEQLFENLQTKSRAVVLRLPSLYGVGQEDSFVDGLARTALKHEPIELFARGQLIRDALHVSDVVKAVDTCIHQYSKNGFTIFNLGCGAKLNTTDYARALVSVLNSQSDIIPVDRPTSLFDLYADISRARKELAFDPMSLAQSMNVYANELRASS